MKDMKRAIRRHHMKRLKWARRWYYGLDQWQDAKWIGMLVHTAKLCSCHGCGNQRRWFGPTLKEIAAANEIADYLLSRLCSADKENVSGR